VLVGTVVNRDSGLYDFSFGEADSLSLTLFNRGAEAGT
jgi:hypothetical protein